MIGGYSRGGLNDVYKISIVDGTSEQLASLDEPRWISKNIINLSLHNDQEQGKLILCVIDNGLKQRNISDIITAVYWKMKTLFYLLGDLIGNTALGRM